jgi:hypothetical protein
MKTLLIALVVTLGSFSAFAQVQPLRLGENLTVKCPQNSQIMVTETNSRTANVSCGSICRLDIGDECKWRGVNCSSSNGSMHLYYIALTKPNGERTQLTNTDSDLTLEDVRSNLQSQAERVKDLGICDDVKY